MSVRLKRGLHHCHDGSAGDGHTLVLRVLMFSRLLTVLIVLVGLQGVSQRPDSQGDRADVRRSLNSDVGASAPDGACINSG